MLYQEIRPSNLSDIVGNTSVVNALKKLVKRDPKDRPHTILLKGPKGCGKTTIARILAKEFGCLPDNIFEYNAANCRGIDTVREAESKFSLAPFGGGSKAYIFDESHQLTSAAQEAFLKSAEDTPSHCYIFFCTTDPQKILPALKNRCSEYSVEPLSSKKILEVLKGACKKKALTFSDEILEIIACNSDGCPRTALVLLEKVLGIEDENQIVDLIVSEIDSGSKVFDLCRMLIRSPEVRKKDWKKILSVFDSLEETDSEKIRYAILGFLQKQLHYIKETDVEFAEDVVKMMEIFSINTFYGKMRQLCGMILKVCFMS